MLNTRDLEQRWLRYKIKSYVPYFTILISIVVISAIIYAFFNSDKKETIYIPEQTNKTLTKAPITKEVVLNTPKAPIIKETPEVKSIDSKESPIIAPKAQEKKLSHAKDDSLKLVPSLGFMKNIQHTTLPYYKEEPKRKPEKVSKIVEETQEIEPQESIEKIVVIEKEEAQQISIKRRDASNDIRDIIKRFKKNNNPALSLFVAKKYYELGEYHKAYNYALITNQIDRDIDASWIIFAKSLVKLNQKDMAIKTLKQYLESSHSSSAKILLDEIVSGKFK
ncbi:MAG: hypothetical protein DRG78_08825 [Epsilonproteobacteria bacterium]|nr:MAG: hypothetical protein DRG78_08825 [Campylobacterota bacterium]